MSTPTEVELYFVKGKIERWIRFGTPVSDQYDRSPPAHRRPSRRAPFSASCAGLPNEHGTRVSRIDILRACADGEPRSTVPGVKPGAEILLRAFGWDKVQRVLRAIDAVEALGFAPQEICPDHWRHVHSRLAAGLTPRAPIRASAIAPGSCARRSPANDKNARSHARLLRRARLDFLAHCRAGSRLERLRQRADRTLCRASDRRSFRHRSRRRATAGAARRLARRAPLPPQRRAADQARRRPARTENLPRRPRRQRRRNCHGAGARARPLGPTFARLARMLPPPSSTRFFFSTGTSRPRSTGATSAPCPIEAVIGRAVPLWTREDD